MDLGAVERELCRIPEVRAARIVADDHGEPIEVHILATTGKGAKQLVRDVQSIAITASGIDLDHRIVSVVQLDDLSSSESATPAAEPTTAEPVEPTTITTPRSATPTSAEATSEPSAPPKAANGSRHPGSTAVPRVVVESVVMERRDLRAVATVSLRRDGQHVLGTSGGTTATTARWRIIAEATLDGIRSLEPRAACLAVESAGVQRIGERELGIVTLTLVTPPNEELLAGVAPVRGGTGEDAIARAVLDATNRRLSQSR